MPSAPGDQSIVFDWNVPRQTMKLLSYAREREDVFWSVIGASWFWFLGAAIMAQLPVFTRDVLLADDTVANVFIGLFTIGIGAGSLLTNSLLKGDVSPRYVPIASIMMTVFLLDLYFAAGSVNAVLAGTSRNTVSRPSSATGRAGASASTCSSSPSSAASMRCRSTPSCSTAPTRRGARA